MTSKSSISILHGSTNLHQPSEWSERFLQYETITAMINQTPTGDISARTDSLAAITTLLDQEIDRVNAFFLAAEASLAITLVQLSGYLGPDKSRRASIAPSDLSMGDAGPSPLHTDRAKSIELQKTLSSLHEYMCTTKAQLLRLGGQLHLAFPTSPAPARYMAEASLERTYIFSKTATNAMARATSKAHLIQRAIDARWGSVKAARLEEDPPTCYSATPVIPTAAPPIRTSLMDLEKQMMQQPRSWRQAWTHYGLRSVLCVFSALLIFALILFFPLFPVPEQNKCFALLVLASTLWATEALPLYVTSLTIPLLVVVLRVLLGPSKDGLPGEPLTSPEASKAIASAMFSPIILLLLGGFAIAGALDNLGIARRMAGAVLARAGERPSIIILVIMLFATVASGFVSNVTAPVLCLGIVRPILARLPASSNSAKALVLGIALASCIGGMATPIASPQNVLALALLDPIPSWPQFLILSIPLSIVADLLVWAVLILVYRPDREPGSLTLPPAPTEAPWGARHYFVILVTLTTIGLWCATGAIENWVGDMGMIALLPLIAFFGSGILGKEDLHRLPWPVVVLAMGGMSLGRAVSSSGLLTTVALSISATVANVPLWGLVWLFGGIMGVVATFVSHTVSAVVLLPVVAEVGAAMAEPHPRLLVLMTMFICSIAMGLPVSGFPNMTAVMTEDAEGDAYLRTSDFIKVGISSSILCIIATCTLGFALGLWMHM